MNKRQTNNWFTVEGEAYPLGATWTPDEQAYNFALYSKHATSVTLLLFAPHDLGRRWSASSWTICVTSRDASGTAASPRARCGGPAITPIRLTDRGQRALMSCTHLTAKRCYWIRMPSRSIFLRRLIVTAAMQPGSNMGKAPLGVLFEDEPTFAGSDEVPFHQHDLVIYEMHVRGFTRRPNSGVRPEDRGTYRGVIDKIPYLKELGVTAVELLAGASVRSTGGQLLGLHDLEFLRPTQCLCLGTS